MIREHGPVTVYRSEVDALGYSNVSCSRPRRGRNVSSGERSAKSEERGDRFCSYQGFRVFRVFRGCPNLSNGNQDLTTGPFGVGAPGYSNVRCL